MSWRCPSVRSSERNIAGYFARKGPFTKRSQFGAMRSKTLCVRKLVLALKVSFGSEPFPLGLPQSHNPQGICPHNRLASDFSIYPRGRCGRAHLKCNWKRTAYRFCAKSSNQFTAYSFHPIQVRFFLDDTGYQTAQSLIAGFFCYLEKALRGRAS